MVLGLLPSIRGGLGELARTGQHARLLDGYLKRYVTAFDEVRYFSYLDESLAEFTDDAELLARVRFFPGIRRHPWLYALLMPLRYRRELAGCAVLRVFQVTGVVPALVAKRLLGVPFVTTYGFWYGQLARTGASAWLRRWVEKVGLAAADAVIVTTPELGEHVRRVEPRAPIHLIPNGVDVGRFRPVPRAPGATRTVMYAGRLSPEKNLGTLIEAAGKLVGRFDFRVAIIGDGPARESLATRAGTLGVPVEFRPFVDHGRLPAVLAEADVFVLPSFTEGHPKILLEAMSCGLPCVASTVSGNQAIVVDGETGLLFDPADAGALARRLEHLLTHEPEARELGRRARQAIVARYDLGTLVGREIELLRRVARAR